MTLLLNSIYDYTPNLSLTLCIIGIALHTFLTFYVVRFCIMLFEIIVEEDTVGPTDPVEIVIKEPTTNITVTSKSIEINGTTKATSSVNLKLNGTKIKTIKINQLQLKHQLKIITKRRSIQNYLKTI